MTPRRIPHLYAPLTRFCGDRRGVSAVEFALLLPLMVMLYLGGVEISNGVSVDRKVTLATRTVADLASQSTSINNVSMTNLLTASTATVAPFAVANLKVTVSCITIDAQGKATISWSDTLNGTAHTRGETVALPQALAVPNTSLIWSEVQYAYKPTTGYVITGTVTLKDQIYMRPRQSDTVTRTAT
jgi:Flp pilus assembly protein TadG